MRQAVGAKLSRRARRSQAFERERRMLVADGGEEGAEPQSHAGKTASEVRLQQRASQDAAAPG